MPPFTLNSLKDFLPDYNSRFPAEQERCNQFRELIASSPLCAARENLAGHLTSSVFVVHPTTNSFLLLHHKKLNKWLQPGGHIEGSDFRESALRELWEETGLAVNQLGSICECPFDLDIHPIPARANEPAHLHYDLRFLVEAKTQSAKSNHESNELRWFEIAELVKVDLDSSISRMIKKAFFT